MYQHAYGERNPTHSTLNAQNKLRFADWWINIRLSQMMISSWFLALPSTNRKKGSIKRITQLGFACSMEKIQNISSPKCCWKNGDKSHNPWIRRKLTLQQKQTKAKPTTRISKLLRLKLATSNRTWVKIMDSQFLGWTSGTTPPEETRRNAKKRHLMKMKKSQDLGFRVLGF